jgi:poly(ADP-ribose) glycohydrolase ARH3
MLKSMPPLLAKFQGCLLASALGDAIGELAFTYPQETRLRQAVAQAEVLSYTDDTAMTLALTESLAELGRLDQEHLGRNFHRHYRQEPWRGYASGPPTIFRLVAQTGTSYVDAARRLFGGAGSLGNGATMRVAPVGLFFYDSPELYQAAAASAAVTHAHPLAQDGAALQAWAVARLLPMEPAAGFPRTPFLEGLVNWARTPVMQEKLRLVQTLLANRAATPEAARALGRSVKIHESLPFAFFAFLAHPQSYEDCLLAAILHGGDRDTLGAMAGALSGAYLGQAALPGLWRARLENRSRIEALASALFQVKTSP